VGFLLWFALVPPPSHEQTVQSDYGASSVSLPISSDERLADYTEALAAFTAMLAIVTVALAGASIWQGILTKQSIDLARAEFNVTHRPKIIVKAFQMTGASDLEVGEAPTWVFLAQNIGDSPGKIIQVRSGTIVLTANEKIPNDLSFPFHEDFNITLVSREKELFPCNGGSPLVGTEDMTIFAGTDVLLCMGIIVYVDESGIQRETGFCRRYRSREREWDTVMESEYEYAY
jgi:hypothetical protein